MMQDGAAFLQPGQGVAANMAMMANATSGTRLYKSTGRKSRGRRTSLGIIVSRLEREHVALLLAICELEAPKQHEQQSQALREALLPLLREDLRQTQRALARAAHGAFGICDDCHKQLTVRELEAHPTLTHCVTCQARLRQRSRRS